jgi:hypothetical protein
MSDVGDPEVEPEPEVVVEPNPEKVLLDLRSEYLRPTSDNTDPVTGLPRYTGYPQRMVSGEIVGTLMEWE